MASRGPCYDNSDRDYKCPGGAQDCRGAKSENAEGILHFAENIAFFLLNFRLSAPPLQAWFEIVHYDLNC